MRAIAIFVHITHLYYLIYAFAAYVSKNKVIKSGVCPRTTGASTTVCNSNCQIDYDCHGIKKCCQFNACSTRCTRPVLVDVGGSGSSTIFDRGTILDTRGSAVGGISRGGHETISVESSKRIIKTSSSGNVVNLTVSIANCCRCSCCPWAYSWFDYFILWNVGCKSINKVIKMSYMNKYGNCYHVGIQLIILRLPFLLCSLYCSFFMIRIVILYIIESFKYIILFYNCGGIIITTIAW
jgi:hypothetical protein